MQARLARPTLATTVLLLTCLGTCLDARDAQAARRITPEDYYAFEFFSDPRLSPDGTLVAYVVTTSDRASGRSRTSVWVAPSSGASAPREITPGPWPADSPRWSPDGRTIAFLSARGDGDERGPAVPQAYVVPGGGGTARPLTEFPGGVTALEWSPDGTRLAVVARTGPDDERGAGGKPVRIGRHITTSIYRTPGPNPWLDDRRGHIWVVDASSGKAAQVTKGDDWEDRAPRWSPDGTRIAFVSDRTGHFFDARGQDDVHVVTLGTGEVRTVSRHERTKHPRIPAPRVSSPAWSPDGTRIAYFAAVTYEAFPTIWIAPADGASPPVEISQDLDLSPTNLQWADEGTSLCFEANARGERHLFRGDVATGRIMPVTKGPRFIVGADVSARLGRVAYVARDVTHINDLYVADLSGANERKIAAPASPIWKELELAEAERFPFTSVGGLEIDGFFMKPVGWKPGVSYPMVLVIHGGPSYMYGMDWEHEFQVYAAKGWAVLYTNPRGSTGYGNAFQRAVKGDWGEKPSIDVINAIETISNKYPWLDRGRLGVTGLSYGGYLTNWLVGHHADVFEAAVTVNGCVNHVSQDGTRFAPFPRFADFGGTVWEAHDTYWKNSPLPYASGVKTPTLVLQSEHDFMVSLEQAQQWFRGLKYYNVTTEMVVFPGANHFGLNSYVPTLGREPPTVVEALEWRLYWFDRFLNGNERSPTPGAGTRSAGSVNP